MTEHGPVARQYARPQGERETGDMLNFVVGDSELAKRIRAHAWEETELGPLETWPESLKTLVTVMLSANQQMYVVWGPGQILIYNDRYIEVLKGHHPNALGRPFLEVWSDIADDLRPLVEKAYAGVPTYMDDIPLFLEREGSTEETHFAYSYTPLLSASGGIDGFFCTCIETTEQVKAARANRETEWRQAFMLKLADALRPLDESDAIMATAARLLRGRLGGSRCAYYEIDGDDYVVISDSAEGVPSFVGRHPLTSFGEPLLEKHRSGTAQIVVEDVVAEHVPGDLAGFESIQVGAYVAVPLVKGQQFVAGLTVQSRTARKWRDADVALVLETAERTWAAVERARAEAALRESEARLQLILHSMSDAVYVGTWDGITVANDAALEQLGYNSCEQLNRQIATLAEEIRTRDYATGAPIAAEDQAFARALRGEDVVQDVRITHRRTGQDRVLRCAASPLIENGQVVAAVAVNTDITELKHAEGALRDSRQHLQVLVAELQHRVRNTLAIVRSIARRTAQNSGTVEDLSAHLDGRLDAFARVQAMVTRRPGAGIDLAALIEDELVAHATREGQSVKLEGPEVALATRPAETLSLAIHELATNAVKYGALSPADGRLVISWALADGRFTFNWTESGVPEMPAAPGREGFGLELLRRVVPYEMSAETEVAFRPDGLSFTLSMPADGNIRVL